MNNWILIALQNSISPHSFFWIYANQNRILAVQNGVKTFLKSYCKFRFSLMAQKICELLSISFHKRTKNELLIFIYLSTNLDRSYLLVFIVFNETSTFDCLKPNYFKKQCSSSSFLLLLIYWYKLAWSTQQASSMHLIHGTTMLSTPLPFWTCIITLGSKNELCFLK